MVILDNLSTGRIKPIEILKRQYDNLEFIKVDLKDKEEVEKIFAKKEIDAVMHFAGKLSVCESMEEPALYHQENFVNSINLIEAMTKAGVTKFIFSSSCVVYGLPEYTPIDENHPTHPQSPYGQTKLDFEQYLSKVANLKYVIFRYFNVAGSDPEGLLGKSDVDRNDLMGNIMKVALNQKNKLEIYGNDYKTTDGTAIRDFLHVEDIANAHILALKKIDNISGEIYNLGSENGFSVKEVISQASKIFGREIPTQIKARRTGDIPVSSASAKKAKEILDWQPHFSDLETIIRTDWNWRKSHPLGYTER